MVADEQSAFLKVQLLAHLARLQYLHRSCTSTALQAVVLSIWGGRPTRCLLHPICASDAAIVADTRRPPSPQELLQKFRVDIRPAPSREQLTMLARALEAARSRKGHPTELAVCFVAFARAFGALARLVSSFDVDGTVVVVGKVDPADRDHVVPKIREDVPKLRGVSAGKSVGLLQGFNGGQKENPAAKLTGSVTNHVVNDSLLKRLSNECRAGDDTGPSKATAGLENVQVWPEVYDPAAGQWVAVDIVCETIVTNRALEWIHRGTSMLWVCAIHGNSCNCEIEDVTEAYWNAPCRIQALQDLGLTRMHHDWWPRTLAALSGKASPSVAESETAGTKNMPARREGASGTTLGAPSDCPTKESTQLYAGIVAPASQVNGLREAMEDKKSWSSWMQAHAQKLEVLLWAHISAGNFICKFCGVNMDCVEAHLCGQRHYKKVWTFVANEHTAVACDSMLAPVQIFEAPSIQIAFNHLSGAISCVENQDQPQHIHGDISKASTEVQYSMPPHEATPSCNGVLQSLDIVCGASGQAMVAGRFFSIYFSTRFAF